MDHDHCQHQQQSSQHAQSTHATHGMHAGHSVALFKRRFWVSLVLTIPVLLYSDMMQQWFHISLTPFPGSGYVPLIGGTIIFFYGGTVFLKGAIHELRMKMPGMMTLISLAIVTSYIYSVGMLFVPNGKTFFWELASLVTIMLLGHWIEMTSVAKADSALGALARLVPDTAEKLVSGVATTVPIHQLQVGDTVLVRPGGRVPIDGIVIDGVSSVDEATFTGESTPTDKHTGDEVVAGTMNQNGALTVQVSKIGDDTALAGIMRLVTDAQQSRSHTQILADKAALVLTIVAVAAATITFVGWCFVGNMSVALERAVTVLIIACPHALGLAIPLVVSIATALSARNGLLIRHRLALESARNLTWVLFDKTGTLTEGKPSVTTVLATASYTEDDIVRLAASIEQQSEHVVGKGIVAEAKNRHLILDESSDVTALPGLGVTGHLREYGSITVASYPYITKHQLSIPNSLTTSMAHMIEIGHTNVFLIKNDHDIIGAIALADTIRPQSKETITALQSIGIKTAMVTGGSEAVAAHIAHQLGIDTYMAEVKPADKASYVHQLQSHGDPVAFVGDGINDAPALATADVGIAIGTGTDIAIKSADIMLVRSDPRDVLKIIRLSQATYRKMIQNLVWAAGYNVIAIPLASGVLYATGIILSPAVGAILMSVSTVVVACNAQLLWRAKL